MKPTDLTKIRDHLRDLHTFTDPKLRALAIETICDRLNLAANDWDNAEITCRTQAQEIAKHRADEAMGRTAHRSVKKLRARIAALEADQAEKAAAIRSQEKECTRLREMVETQRGEIGKLFARASECDTWKLRAKHHDASADNNARRLVAVVEIMDRLAHSVRIVADRLAAEVGHNTTKAEGQALAIGATRELRAALAKVPGPRENLPLAPEPPPVSWCAMCNAATGEQHRKGCNTYPKWNTYTGLSPSQERERLWSAMVEPEQADDVAPPPRCTCAYPLPTIGLGWDRTNELHAAGCPVTAGATMWYKGRPVIARPIPSGPPVFDYTRPPYPRRAEVNPATMPDARPDFAPIHPQDSTKVVQQRDCWGGETACPDCERKVGQYHTAGCELKDIHPPEPIRLPVTEKDRNARGFCERCGEGVAHVERCPWNLAKL